MMILSIILGILMIIGGVVCMASPLTTFLSTGHFLCIMLLLFSIVGIIRFVKKQSNVLEIVLSILALILCAISLFLPGTSLVFDSLMIYLTAAWYVVLGIVSIVLSIKMRKEEKFWFLGVITGIIGVALGVYSFLHPQVVALSTGMLIGFYFIETGITMIAMSIVVGSNEN